MPGRAGSGVGKYNAEMAQNRSAKGSTLLKRRFTLPIQLYYFFIYAPWWGGSTSAGAPAHTSRAPPVGAPSHSRSREYLCRPPIDGWKQKQGRQSRDFLTPIFIRKAQCLLNFIKILKLILRRSLRLRYFFYQEKGQKLNTLFKIRHNLYI